MSEPDYILLLHKSFIGEISNEEKAVLDAWLADNSSNQAAADDLKQVWSGNWKEGPFKIDRKHVLSQRQRLIQRVSELKEQETSNLRLKIRYQLVASVVILLVTTIATINFISNNRTQPFTIVAEGKKIVTLAAGGGQVIVNDGTTITLAQDIDTLAVDLAGEAYFQLAQNNIPVSVHIPGGSVAISGSCFFVRASKTAGNDIAATSDRLVISVKETKINLDAYKHLSIIDGSIKPRVGSNIYLDTWYTGTLVFKKATVKDIIDLLSAQYDVHFQLPDEVLSSHFTGTFINEELESIVALLAGYMDLTYEYKDGVYYFNRKPVSKNIG